MTWWVSVYVDFKNTKRHLYSNITAGPGLWLQTQCCWNSFINSLLFNTVWLDILNVLWVRKCSDWNWKSVEKTESHFRSKLNTAANKNARHHLPCLGLTPCKETVLLALSEQGYNASRLCVVPMSTHLHLYVKPLWCLWLKKVRPDGASHRWCSTNCWKQPVDFRLWGITHIAFTDYQMTSK